MWNTEIDHLEALDAVAFLVEDPLQAPGIRPLIGAVVAKRRRCAEGDHANRTRGFRVWIVVTAQSPCVDRDAKRLPNRLDAVYHAVVSEVGSAATSANAFPVKANINDADKHVRPGMTAELTLLFSREEEEETAYLVPMQALEPGMEKDDQHVFVFDSETSTVRKTVVQGKGIVGNQAIITNGIAPGDIIVVAGVPFLLDGQEVKLLNPSHAGQ